MQLNRRTLLGATALGLASLAVAGCTKAPEGGSNQPGGSGGAIAGHVNDMNPKERGEMGEGGTLRLTNNAYPANWNTFHSDGNEVNTNDIMLTLYPALTRIDASGKVEANPEYAKRIEQKSADPLVIEIELKEGLKWSDGTPIDYKSIENVFLTMNGSKPDYGIVSSEGYNKVDKIEKGANDLTAVVTFKEKYADWIGLVAVMPDSLAATAAAFNEGWLESPKVTAGPFKVDALDPANKTVTIVPDPNWTGTKPLLSKVLWTTIEDPSAAATSYKNGQLDAIETSVPATYTVLKDLVGKGSVLRKAAGPNWTHLTLNGAEGRPLADEKVRQAVFRAVDRKEVFLAVHAAMPYPSDLTQQNHQILVTNQDGYKDTSGDYGKYDIEAAKKLLTEAGFTFEGGKAVKDGKPLEITYVYNDGSKTNEAVIPVVKESLGKAGITLNVQKVPPTDLFAKFVIPGNYDITLFGWAGNPYLSSGDAIWKRKGEQNFSGKIGTEEIDKLLDQASVETDPKKRIDFINQASEKLWAVAGTLPLWQAYTFFIQDKDLANFGARGFATVDWTKVGYVKDSPKLK